MAKDQSLFWADAGRLASLSAAVAAKPKGQAPRPRPSVPPSDAPSAPAPPSTAPPSTASPVDASLSTVPPQAAAPQLAAAASAVTTPAAETPAVETGREIPFQLPQLANTEERLQALVQWLLEDVQCTKVCVADSEGLALISSGIKPLWVAAVAEIGRQWTQIQEYLDLTATGALTLRRDEDIHLLVQPSRLGRLSLLFVMPDSEMDIPFAKIQQAFTLWIREEEGALSHDT